VIDDDKIPQGLAGNSAYIIKPEGARRLLELVKEYGLWPNDAIMCRQLISKLGITKTYYTKVQGLESTTSL
jgi:GR25 family glycosyltransferase involved in LPS biosynthesis